MSDGSRSSDPALQGESSATSPSAGAGPADKERPTTVPPSDWKWIIPLGLYLTAWLAALTWQVSTHLPDALTKCQRSAATDEKRRTERQKDGRADGAADVAAQMPAASPEPADSPDPAPASPSPALPATSPQSSPQALDESTQRSVDCVLKFPYLLWLLGCLGASVSATWALVRRVGLQPPNRDRLTPAWIPYYIVRPLIGGVVGLVSVLGLDLLQFRPASATPLLFLAFAAGLVSRQATLKLRELAQALFNSRDALDEKPDAAGGVRS